METNEFFVSRDVVFDEAVFPYGGKEEDTTLVPVAMEFGSYDDDSQSEHVVDRGSVDKEVVPMAERESVTEEDNNNTSADMEVTTEQPVAEEVLGRGQRQPTQSVRLRDYVLYNAHKLPDKHSTISRTTTPVESSTSVPGKTHYPITDYVTDAAFSDAHQAFLAAVSDGLIPKSYKEAFKDKKWRKAVKVEVDALELSRTWDLVDLPKGKKAIGSKWVFTIKYNANGTIERHKGRLVCCGNHQVEGEDYEETFAPVAKMDTVRTLLEVAAAKNWEVHQMDVHNAFLHGDLEEEVYMRLPPGFHSDDPNKVCKLRKSLYGLKQAPRCWFEKLTKALTGFGFVQSYVDYSLFTYIKGEKSVRVLIYVDDLIVAGNDLDTMIRFKKYLSDCFHMKDLGKVKYFLGIEIARGPQGMFLSQRKYALDIVNEVGLLGCKPASTPMEINHQLLADDSPLCVDPIKFRRVVGRLVYLTITRPDLSYAVHVLSQVMHEPRQAHWNAVMRVLRYLKGSPGQGIMLRSDSDLKIRAYCDSDYNSCPRTRRSLSAYMVLLGNSPVAWKTKKQDTVSHSSAEAEYRAMSDALKELKWLKRLLEDLGVKHEAPMELYCDSKAAIYIAANPVFHERTKHIEKDCHSVRDAVKAKLITTVHVRTNEQLADILTKALGTSSFCYLLSKFGVCDLHSPT